LKRIFTAGKQSYATFSGAQGTSFAQAIAYNVLFSIFPLVAFIVGFAGYFLDQAQRAKLVNNLTSALGGSGSAGIHDQVQTFASGKAALGIIGLLTALWSASAVFGAIRTGLNAIWQVKQGRPFIVAKALDLASVLGLFLVLGLSAAGTVGATAITALVKHLLGTQVGGGIAFLLGLVFFFLPVLIVFAAFCMLFTLVSPSSVRRQDVWHGALFASIAFQLLNFLFGFYIKLFGSKYGAYGAGGAVIAFLFYAYLAGCVILFGAAIAERTAQTRNTRQTPRHPSDDGTDQRPVIATPLKGSAGAAAEIVTVGELFPERDSDADLRKTKGVGTAP